MITGKRLRDVFPSEFAEWQEYRRVHKKVRRDEDETPNVYCDDGGGGGRGHRRGNGGGGGNEEETSGESLAEEERGDGLDAAAERVRDATADRRDRR